MPESPLRQPNAFIRAISELRTTAQGAFVELIWADLRDGMIDLRGLARPVRAIIWLGFCLATLCLILLTQAPTLRALFPLHTSVSPAPGRGLHIPLVLFPLSLFLLSLAWTYLLIGARQSQWLIRIAVFGVYTLTCAAWLATLLASDPWIVVIGGALYVLLLTSFLLPHTLRLHRGFHFTLILFLVGGIFAVVQYPLVLQDQASGLPIGKTILESNVRSLATLVLPLLIIIGLDIAHFTVSASSWMGETVTRLLPRMLLPVAIGALWLWLAWQGVSYLISQQATITLFSYVWLFAGTGGLFLLLWLAWVLLARLNPTAPPTSFDEFTNAATKVALILVIAFLLPLLSASLFLELAQVIQTIAVELQSGFFGDYQSFANWSSALFATALNFSSTIYFVQPLWQRICAAVAIGMALLLYHRGHTGSALYAITAGVTYLWVEITRPGNWLQSLGWTSQEPVVFTWTLFLSAWVIYLSWNRQMDSARLHRLFIVLLLLLLMRQTSLIAAPLDPLFSLAGIGYLAVGLGWDLLTAGSWANATSTTLPRASRIYLYLGYMILTVTLVNWAVAAHDFTLLERFTGETALMGLSLLGYPFLYATIYLLLTNPLTTTGATQPPELED